jgi:DNA-binding response OmpR family regulator
VCGVTPSPVAKRILSIAYDVSLLLTLKYLLEQAGFEVVSAEGFLEATQACDANSVPFDLIILGHTIPRKDKEKIIAHIRQQCSTPILALLKSYEGSVDGANRSVDAFDPNLLVATVREMLEASTRNGSLEEAS